MYYKGGAKGIIEEKQVVKWHGIISVKVTSLGVPLCRACPARHPCGNSHYHVRLRSVTLSYVKFSGGLDWSGFSKIGLW